jgi:hypothetical protein
VRSRKEMKILLKRQILNKKEHLNQLKANKRRLMFVLQIKTTLYASQHPTVKK